MKEVPNEKFLILETSTPQGGLALFDGDSLLQSWEFEARRGHNAALFAPLEESRQWCLRQDFHLDRIIVGLGPGSYTGIRIGIAAGQALAMAWDLPLSGLSSFLGINSDGHRSYTVSGDARRGLRFKARIEEGVLITPIEIIPAEEWADPDDAAEQETSFTLDHPPFSPLLMPRQPRVALLGKASHSQARQGTLTTGPTLEPLYLLGPHITKSQKKPPFRNEMKD
ncbi:MAG: tRNA (adenosine(37)-N6)-threonylcarbamoyltransferase complex dimerization subunit type 1 TsaB [Verrucomicrobiota bacterium]